MKLALGHALELFVHHQARSRAAAAGSVALGPHDALLSEQLHQWLMVLALWGTDTALAEAVGAAVDHSDCRGGTEGGQRFAWQQAVGNAARVAVCTCLLLGTHQVCVCVCVCV